MASILKIPSHVARLGRHGHDLSRRLLFTSSVGHLLPVMFDYLSPGDRVRINEQLFTRTAPITSPALVRIKEHIEYFFVPMEQINSYFGSAFYGINDLGSSALLPIGMVNIFNGSSNLPASSPSVTVSDLCSALFVSNSGTFNFQYTVDANAGTGTAKWSSTVDNLVYDIFGIPRIFNSLRLLDLLGYGHNFFNSTPTAQGGVSAKNIALNLDAFAVYQKIYYDFYRLSQFESNVVNAYNFDYAMRSVGKPSVMGQNINHLGSTDAGVGDYFSDLLTLHYRPLKKDFFTNVLQSPLYVLNPAKDINPNTYNDSHPSNSVTSYILSTYGVQLQDDAQLNNVTTRVSSQIDPYATGTTTSLDLANETTSIQQLRLAYAYDKMMAITQRAGKHYDDQTKAHFGVSVPQGISGEVYFLGGHTSDLNIAEVVATAAGSEGENTSSLGELAGRGYGASGKQRDIKFTAPCHGYIMAIYSACPEISYSSFGLDRLHTYTSINDFPHPEFDNIGMSPLFLFQLNNSNYYLGGNTPLTPSSASSFFGWQYRWAELKMSYDRTTSGFVEHLYNWAVNYLPGQFSSVRYYDGSKWVQRNLYMANFYCSPDLLDNIFGLQFSPINWQGLDVNGDDLVDVSVAIQNNIGTNISATTVNNEFIGQTGRVGVIWDDSIIYARDPLYHSIDFKYYKASWMSTYGLPSL